MLKMVRPLYELGFAIHLLRPKSKAPIESKWTTGPRKKWSELKAAYKTGMNVGVRLGTPSKLSDGTYLGVIDCDVKSQDHEHVKEMLERVDELWLEHAPVVLSGRGNGSRHLYVKSKRPLRPRKFAQSGELIRTRMPSMAPSKRDKEHLTLEELEQGWRMRPAWEISIMGEGQQVVLPPSIHPDTKEPYSWLTGILDVNQIATFKDPGASKDDTIIEEAGNLDFKAVDIRRSKLPSAIINMITVGKDVDDRSAALFKAASAMVNARFEDSEILAVLTDRGNFLGEAAYEHAKTKNRKKAAKWLAKYTINKVRRTMSARAAFEQVAEVDDSEVERAPKKTKKRPVEDGWRDELNKNDHGQVKTTYGNLKLILTGYMKEKGHASFIRHDEFSVQDQWTTDCPWRSKAGHVVGDVDLVRIKAWLVKKFSGLEYSTERINEVLTDVADTNRFHPVRDYLNNLEWDGVPRLDDWLKTYMRAEGPEDYLSAIGRKTLVAAVARVMEPGIKYDQVLILEGEQGVGKSTTAKILGAPWFSDSHINVADKDSVVNMQGIWIYELGELSSLRKSDIDLIKEFISRSTDKIRLPYGKRTGVFPRQSIFIGTTNSDEYLKDRSGNRRFWPCRVGRVKTKMLKRDRDQLWAEALMAYRLGETLWIEDGDLLRIVQSEQAKRVEHDAMEDAVATYLKREHGGDFNPKCFQMWDLISHGGDEIGVSRPDKATQMRISNCLKTLGYRRTHRTLFEGKKGNWWTPDKG